jgi:hypothetical protein
MTDHNPPIWMIEADLDNLRRMEKELRAKEAWTDAEIIKRIAVENPKSFANIMGRALPRAWGWERVRRGDARPICVMVLFEATGAQNCVGVRRPRA